MADLLFSFGVDALRIGRLCLLSALAPLCSL